MNDRGLRRRELIVGGAAGAAAAALGPLHFAGADTAPLWRGYMDGAVRSGERAAREALAAL